MKKSLFLAILLSIVTLSIAYADIARPFTTILREPSKNCKWGEKITFFDTNGDGNYDYVVKDNCDGSSSGSPMNVVGGNLGPAQLEGSSARILSGSLESDIYVIEIYVPNATGETNVGYLTKTSPLTDPIFYLNGYYTP